MIEIELEVDHSNLEDLVNAIFDLPVELRPISVAEDENDKEIPITGAIEFLEQLRSGKSARLLKGPSGIIDFMFAGKLPVRCVFWLDIPAKKVLGLMRHMLVCQPLFGFASSPEERKSKNRISVTIEKNDVTTWVGRGISRSIPGIYWITIIYNDIMRKFDIDAEYIICFCEKHIVEYDHHIFVIYDTPEEWKNKKIPEIHGVFDIARAKREFEAATSFTELMLVSKKWL